MPKSSFPTSLGACSLSWGERGLSSFNLPVEGRGTGGGGDDPPEWVRSVILRVRRHLECDLQDFSDVAIDWSLVSAFQQAVLKETQRIKPGFTRSYGDIARALSLGPDAARAVGAALAANPWPLVVPCHRVVASTGRMTGFSGPGGVRTKTRLLALEGAELLSE